MSKEYESFHTRPGHLGDQVKAEVEFDYNDVFSFACKASNPDRYRTIIQGKTKQRFVFECPEMLRVLANFMLKEADAWEAESGRDLTKDIVDKEPEF